MLITVGVSGVYNNYLRTPGFSAISKEKTAAKRPLLLFKEIMPTDHVRGPAYNILIVERFSGNGEPSSCNILFYKLCFILKRVH